MEGRSSPDPPPIKEADMAVSSASVSSADGRSGRGPTESSPLAMRRPNSAGHVHWGAESDSSPSVSKSGRIQVGTDGPTVTIRGASGGVNRLNHPGPLNLSSRLGHQGSALAGPITAPAHEQEGQRAVQSAVPDLSLTGAHGLDAEGLDNRAFLELQRELQRHEAQDVAGAEAHELAAAPHRVPEGPSQGGHRQAAEQRRIRRFLGGDTPDWAASGASTPGGYTSDTGSYDPAADSDLGHIDFMAGEVDGMPSRPKRNRQAEDAAEGLTGWAKIRSLMGKIKNTDDDGGVADEEKMAMGGRGGDSTNMKSVPVTTSTGTHHGPRSRPTKFERDAAKLVRAHKLMRGQGLADGAAASTALGRMQSVNRRHLDSEASTPDALDTAANLDARPVAAGGVLGNLLKLYEQQQREERERTAQSSAISTADATSFASTPDREHAREHKRFLSESDSYGQVNEGLARHEAAAIPSPSGRSESARREGSDRRKSWNPSLSTEAALASGTKFANRTGTAAAKSLRFVANETGFDDVGEERPRAARSAAGVVGGLIATTGNLIGAVSPYHAQLGPNPKRPGYTLDRYLLPEMNAKTLKRTAEAVASAAPRPTRRSHSQPGTPGARSPGGPVMYRPEGNVSSDTHAGTPSDKYANGKPPPSMAHSRKHSGNILHIPGHGFNALRTWTTGNSNVNTPDPVSAMGQTDYFGTAEEDAALAKVEWQKKLKKRKQDKRKKEEIFITMHVAAILQRQEFLLKLSRALMMFGAPTHRIETQIQQTARVLEINCRCLYLPNLMLFAFGDDTTHTSETKFIKQGGGLDFTKLTDMHTIYWNVIHDKIGVGEASAQLDELMRRKPLIGRWPMVIIGGFCSAFISIGPMGFGGSFIDAVMAFPLGAFLVFSQSIITTELFSNVFEIMFATLNSFISLAVAHTNIFCYAGVVSGSIVLILPGFIVLSGSLELQSKNLIAGSVRLVYAIIYSLFLGFGLSIGASFWALVSGGNNERSVNTCTEVHDPAKWWKAPVPMVWAFLTVPMYATCLALRNQAKVNRKEFPAMVLIACAGWACNHYAATAKALSGRQDITSALGSLAVGILSNLYGRFFDGRSYVVAVVGVLYQLPSGLSNGGGLLNFAQTSSDGTDNFNSGFTVAQSLVEVALGLTVGLFAATMLAYVLGGRKERRGGLFSF
ncbi:unnamed protein product [Parajaminaea phylloscopi]